jgi:hypothetical protein
MVSFSTVAPRTRSGRLCFFETLAIFCNNAGRGDGCLLQAFKARDGYKRSDAVTFEATRYFGSTQEGKDR